MNINTNTAANTAPGVGVASPCTSVCRISDDTGLCEGCWRSIKEIAAWSAMDDSQRLQVLAAIATRRGEGRSA